MARQMSAGAQGGYGAREILARAASSPTVRRSRTAAQKLSDIMDFDQVIEVMEDGSIVERNDIYAPELSEYEGGYDLEGWPVGMKWELISGFSGQHNYPGPIMHSSEFIGGYMERYIRENPGVYVSVVAYPAEEFDEDGNETYPDGWAVARLKD